MSSLVLCLIYLVAPVCAHVCQRCYIQTNSASLFFIVMLLYNWEYWKL